MPDRSVTVFLRANIAGYSAAMSKAKLQTADFARAAEKDAARHRESWDKVGKGMLLTGGAVGAGLAVGVKAFADFEQSMSRAQAGTMATGRTLDALRAAAIKAGADTQFSATEAADAITAMGKAGVSTGDILGGGLDASLSLAAAGELEVGRAAEIAATAMTQFGLAGTDLPHVADLLAAGAGKAQGSVDDMANALKYVGPVAKGVGISIEETTGVIAEFASQGIIGEQAGTSFRGLLLSLTSPSGVAAKAMDQLGISVYDTSGSFVGMQGVADQLQRRMGGLDEATRNAALGQIFGNEQVTAARVLYAGGAQAVEDWTEKVNDSGFAARQAAMLTDNLKGDIERLGGSLSSVIIQNGSAANSVLRSLTTTTQGAVDWFGQLPGSTQQTAIGLAGVSAAALLAGGSFLVIVPKVAAAKAAMAELNIVTGVTTGRLAAVGKATGALAVTTAVAQAAGQGVDMVLGGNAAAMNKAGESLLAYARSGVEAEKVTGLAARGFKDLGSTIDSAFNDSTFAWVRNNLSWVATLGIVPTEAEESVQFLRELDAGLTSLASSGHAPEAAKVFRQVADAAAEQGYSLADVQDKLPQYQAALDAAADAQAAVAVRTGEAADALPPMTQEMQAASDAAAKWRQQLQDVAASFVTPLDAYTTLLADKKAAEQKSAQATADATKSATDSWEDYAKDVSVSIGEYLRALEDQVKAQQDWETNMLRLSSRVSQGTLDELAKMGPQGAPLVAQLVNASDRELGRMERLFRARADQATGAVADQLTTAGPVLAQVARVAGQKTADGYARKLAEGTATVAGIAKRYGIVIEQNVPDVKATRFETLGVLAAQRSVYDLRAAINSLPDKTVSIAVRTGAFGTSTKATNPGVFRAAGGMVSGPGGPTSDDVPAWLSDGEYVVRAASVAKYGTDMLDALNAGRFAGGGMVGSTVTVRGEVAGSVSAALAPVAQALKAAASAVRQSAVDAPSASGGQGALVALARWLQGQGARASEHQAFGGVHAVHVPGSKHYAKPVSRAIDFNYGPGGQSAAEMAFFDRVAPAIRAKGFNVLWRVPGHYNHLHAAYASGGQVGRRVPASAPRMATGGRVALSPAAREAREKAAEVAAQVRSNRADARFDALSPEQQVRDLDRRMAAERRYTDEWMQLAGKRREVVLRMREDERKAADERATLAANRAQVAFDRMGPAQQVRDLDRQLAAERRYSDAWMQLAGKRRAVTEQQREVERAAAREKADAAATIASNRAEFRFDGLSPAQQVADLDKRLAGERRYTDEWMRLQSQRSGVLEQIASAQRQADEDRADAAKRAADAAASAAERVAEAAAVASRAAAERAQGMADNRAVWEFEHLATDQQITDLDRRIAAEEAFTDQWMRLQSQRAALVEQVSSAQRAALEAQAQADAQAAAARRDAQDADDRMIASNRGQWEFDHLATRDKIANLDARLAGERAFTDEWMRLTSQRQALADEVAAAEDAAAAPGRERAGALGRFAAASSVKVTNTQRFYSNLQTLADRGFAALAGQLLDQSDSEAETVAEQAAAASDTVVAGLNNNTLNAAAQAAQRARLADSLKGVVAAEQPAWSLPQLMAGVYGSRPSPVAQRVYVQNPWTGEYHEARMAGVVDGALAGLADGLVYGGAR